MEKYITVIITAGLLSSSFALADINTGLALHYDFETDTGITVFDQSGLGNDGAVTGASWTSLAAVGNGAMSFDRDGDYIAAGDILNLDGATPTLTASAWVRMPSDLLNPEVDLWIIGNLDVPAPYTGWAMREWNNQLVGQIITDHGTDHGESAQALGTSPILDDMWHHVVSTFEMSSSRLFTEVYVDGLFQKSAEYLNPIGSTINTTQLWIGARHPDASMPFMGTMDDVRVYTRVLNAQEVGELYALGAIPEPSTLTFAALFLTLAFFRRRR